MIIKPPRALWVPFELGRSFGVPNDVKFQTRVVIETLKLFEATSGPVIKDFPENAPISEDAHMVWARPVSFSKVKENLNNAEELQEAFKREIIEMRPWYDIAMKKRGRTTVGVSGLDIDAIGNFIIAFLDSSSVPENPRNDISLAFTLKLCVDDLKAYYYEAVLSQPGQIPQESAILSDWFWGETTAGNILFAVKESCLKSNDGMLKFVGKLLLVPMTQAHRSN